VSGLTLLNDGDRIGLGKFQVLVRAATARAFGTLPDVPVGDEGDERLGGMTLQIAPDTARRAAEDAGRVKGYVLLPRKGSTDLRLFVAESFLVGKGADCDLALGGWFVPKKVALIVRGSDRYSLFNLSDSPKVLVNNKPVTGRVALGDREQIEMFGHRIAFLQLNDGPGSSSHDRPTLPPPMIR